MWKCFALGHKADVESRWTDVPGSKVQELWVFWVCRRCGRITNGHDTRMRGQRGRKPWRADDVA